MLTVDIERDDEEDSPQDKRIREVIAATLKAAAWDKPSEVSLRFVGETEMRDLNHRFRGRACPTNVLSFPAGLPADLGLPLLGDIAICGPVVRHEASDQGKPAEAHWEHMIVHGTLHLLGYDHEDPVEADAMEALERRVLAGLGRPDPYRDTAGAPPMPQASGAGARA